MTLNEALESLGLTKKRDLPSLVGVGKTYFDSKPMGFKIIKSHKIIVNKIREIKLLKKRIFLLSAPLDSYVLIDGSWFEDLSPRGAKMIIEGEDRFIELGDEKINLMNVPQSKIRFIDGVEEGNIELFITE